MRTNFNFYTDCCGGVEPHAVCAYVTNDGPPVDQRKIETIPAPAGEIEIIHAEREIREVSDGAYDIVEGEHGYQELPFLKGDSAPIQTPDLLDIPPVLRGCTPAFMAGFVAEAFDIEGQPPEIVREYTRGQAAANGQECA